MEVGFGPGIGLQEACRTIESGSVYGIDISDKMIEVASERLATELATKRLFLSNQRSVARDKQLHVEGCSLYS